MLKSYGNRWLCSRPALVWSPFAMQILTVGSNAQITTEWGRCLIQYNVTCSHTIVQDKWHLIPSNGFSMVHVCDHRTVTSDVNSWQQKYLQWCWLIIYYVALPSKSRRELHNRQHAYFGLVNKQLEISIGFSKSSLKTRAAQHMAIVPMLFNRHMFNNC